MKKYLYILKKSPLFKGLSDEEIISSTACLCKNIRRIKEGTTVFNEKSQALDFSIVLSGEVILKQTDYNGSENIIARIFPSQILAAASTLSSNRLYPFDGYTECETELLPIRIDNLMYPCQSSCRFHSTIIKNLLTVISDNNILLAEKIEILTKRTIKEKVLAYLHSKAKKAKANSFSIGLNRQQLAQFLSVDRSALSRELSKMQKEGIIKFKENHFTINLN